MNDDMRAGLVVLFIVLAALWMEQRVRGHVSDGLNQSFATGRMVERLIHEEITA